LTGVVPLDLHPTAMHETSDSSVVEHTSPSPQTLIIPPDDGDTIHAYGDTALGSNPRPNRGDLHGTLGSAVKLSGEQTMVVVVGTSPPGGGPPPHRHRNEDEMFIVMEGKIRFLVNGQWSEPLAPGTIVYTPRGVVHTFQNVGETLCRQWIIATPSGFERFFSRSAEVFAAAGAGAPPDMVRLLAISAECGIEFVPPL
jgi:quercetin dioxygenase-like cupin family protein